MRSGWIAMATIFGLFFTLLFIATMLATRERPEFQKPPRPFHWKQAFIEPFQVRTFVFVLFMYVTAFSAFDAVSSIVVYYIKTYLGRGEEVSFVLGTLLIAQVLSLPFYQWFSRCTSKPRAYMVEATTFVTVMFFSFLITPNSPTFTLYLFAALVGLGSGGVVMMIYAIFPDIPDVDELRSGERREGIFSALTTFTRKVSSALATFSVTQMLALAGYIPPAMIEGKLIEQTQTPQFTLALRFVFVFLPVAFISIGIYFATRFPLSVERHQRLRTILELARRGQTVDEKERQESTKVLIGWEIR